MPQSIEQLEEVIQDHREFLLDLDSHKSVAMSINVVGCHLAEHSPTQSKADGMRQRLADINEKWDAVCEQATLWQTRLQTALLEVILQSVPHKSAFSLSVFRMESFTRPYWSCSSGWTPPRPPSGRLSRWTCGWPGPCCTPSTTSSWSCSRTSTGASQGWSPSRRLRTS